MSILAMVASPAGARRPPAAVDYLADLRADEAEVVDLPPAEIAARVAASVGIDDLARIEIDPGGITLLNRGEGEATPMMVNVDPTDPLRLAPGSRRGRRVYVIRHGEADTPDAEGRLHSRAPLPLTPRGRTQVATLGEAFAPLRVAEVHASDLRRTEETARAVAGPRRVRLHAGLRELALGDFEGAHADEVLAVAPGFLIDPDAALPGGESIRDVRERTVPVLEDLLADGEDDLVVVAHGGVNRGLIGGLVGLPLERAIRIRQDWAGVNLLEQRSTAWIIRGLNWTPEGVRELDRTGRTTHLHERAGGG
jgi:broad specificity phosphatase PhoE